VLDAFIEALRSTIKLDFEVLDYGEHALGQGADAEAVTYIQLKCEGKRYTGVAISKDIISSSLNALMSAVSDLLASQADQVAA
jgi:2-isopropylmalate synthase